ncbi:hypothetical protein AC579_7460 [Pseudocercospora musae]|uniref:Uncharacterized protein n=1 Tax=Pseudocercospora musae TaxID=113226 RepID=A0A139H7R4_9PEZI|nr:hypothetical protein AC579_7460 [Pseudocercospora musae]
MVHFRGLVGLTNTTLVYQSILGSEGIPGAESGERIEEHCRYPDHQSQPPLQAKLVILITNIHRISISSLPISTASRYPHYQYPPHLDTLTINIHRISISSPPSRPFSTIDPILSHTMPSFSLNTWRVPSKYFSADTLNTKSSYTVVDVPPVEDSGPTLKPAAASLTVYANLTLGNVLRQSRDNPSARIDFKQVPSFGTDARSAAKKISQEAYDDPEQLMEFGRMVKVPMRFGPDAWTFIMQKIGDKLEREGIWKHKAGQSIKKSLEMAVQIFLSEGRFGGDSDEVEGFEDDGVEEYGRARKRSSSWPRLQTPPAPGRGSSSRSDDGSEECEEGLSKSPRQQTPPAPRRGQGFSRSDDSPRRGSSSRSVTAGDGADSGSSDEGYGSDGRYDGGDGSGKGVRVRVRSSAKVAELRAEIMRKVASKKDVEAVMAEGEEVREEVRRSVDKVSARVKKLEADVADHGRRIESSEEGLLNVIEETKSDDYMALVSRRLHALDMKNNSAKRK